MPPITGTELASDAFAELNVFLPGEALPPADGAFALRKINDMLSAWSQRSAFIPVISRNQFPLVANQGGPYNPYTIGPAGNFVFTPRPPNQRSIQSASLILTVSSPTVRIPLGIYTDEAYDANAIPDLANTQPTGLYYSPTYVNDLGAISLWPVPDNSINKLELFIQQPVAQFSNLSTTYYVPDGWPEALKYNLARRLQTPYGKQLSQEWKQLAVASEGVIKRANLKMSDLMNDVNWTGNRATVYNVLTGQGGA